MWSAAAVLVCALELLGRSPEAFPSIRLLDAAPPDASASVEGFVRAGDPTIYLIASSAPFLTARASTYRCGERDALRKIASIVIHEEWHVRNGADERGAYQAQLMALMRMGVPQDGPLYTGVTRAMLAVTTARRPASVQATSARSRPASRAAAAFRLR